MIMNECPHCGANLDPGEVCDCQEKMNKIKNFWFENTEKEASGQLKLNLEGDKIWQQ